MCGNITLIHNEELLSDSDNRVGRTAVLNPGSRVTHLQVTLHRYYVSFHTMNLSISILMQTVVISSSWMFLNYAVGAEIEYIDFLSVTRSVCPKAQQMKNN